VLKETITVVIATRERRLFLMRTLALLGTRTPVIVIDDGSHDGTAGAVRDRFPWVRLVPLATSAGPSARNIGVKLATTPLVAFTDDDAWYERGALAAAMRIFRTRPRLGLIAARVLVGREARLDPTCEAMAAAPLHGFLACGAIVRRDAFMAAGGFHQWMTTGGEEEYVATRMSAAGWELEYRSDVVVHHWPPRRNNPSARRQAVARNGALTELLLHPGAKAVAGKLRKALVPGTLDGLAAGLWLQSHSSLTSRATLAEETPGVVPTISF
jgi:glycosyltransferase involved in cell wall biosynthesis